MGLSNPQDYLNLPVYNDALEGHQLYKWDQEMMIQLTFNMLDNGNKGYLSKEDISIISYDTTVHDLLKYTVFWSIIKRREWNIFEELFASTNETNQQIGAANNNNQPEDHQQHVSGQNSARPPFTKMKSNSSVRSNHSAHNHHHNHHLLPLPPPSSHPSSALPTGRLVEGPSIHGLSSTAAAMAISQFYRSSQIPKDTISYFQLLDCALSLSKEVKCHIQYIRTQEEHDYYTNLVSSGAGNSRRNRVHFPSTYWDNDHNGILRHFQMMRKLSVGDCVWALHRKGVRWLPAVIMKIHFPKTNPTNTNKSSSMTDQHDPAWNGFFASAPSTADPNNKNEAISKKKADNTNEENYYYYYDLWFPLSEKELTKAKMTTISKQLLTLPSQTNSLNSNPNGFQSLYSMDNNSSFLFTGGGGGGSQLSALPKSSFPHGSASLVENEDSQFYLSAIPPKPFDSERQCCAYAFDLIDSNSCGIINLLMLIQSMQSKELIHIVNTSLILSLIFRTSQTLEEILLAKDETLSMLIELELQTLQQKQEQSQLSLSSPNGSVHTNTNNSHHNNNNQNVNPNSQTDANIENLMEMSKAKDKQKKENNLFRLPCFLSVFIDTFATDQEEHHDELNTIRKLQEEHSSIGGGGSSSTLRKSRPTSNRHDQVERLHEEEDAIRELKEQEQELYGTKKKEATVAVTTPFLTSLPQEESFHSGQSSSVHNMNPATNPLQPRQFNNNNHSLLISEENSYLNDFADTSTILPDGDSVNGGFQQNRKNSNNEMKLIEDADMKKMEEENKKFIKLQKKINQISQEFISKLDFLEFCDCIYNIIKYDIHWNHSNYDEILKKLPPPFEKWKKPAHLKRQPTKRASPAKKKKVTGK
jgi:hypothetical protein